MKQPSGKFVVRIPAALHAQLKGEATATAQSLNQVCISKLQASATPDAGLRATSAATELISPGFLDAILQRWCDTLIGIILFGSAARGDDTEDSDIDLVLVMDAEVKIVRALYRLWEDFCREQCGTQDSGRFSPHFVNLPESIKDAGGLWYEVAIEGIILWESEYRISRFLSAVRAAMGQGKIRRRMVHGSPYWVKEF
jgi:hypothetical protein